MFLLSRKPLSVKKNHKAMHKCPMNSAVWIQKPNTSCDRWVNYRRRGIHGQGVQRLTGTSPWLLHLTLQGGHALLRRLVHIVVGMHWYLVSETAEALQGVTPTMSQIHTSFLHSQPYQETRNVDGKRFCFGLVNILGIKTLFIYICCKLCFVCRNWKIISCATTNNEQGASLSKISKEISTICIETLAM